MTLTLRMLWLILFAFWQGGFMFYGAIVVPVGTQVLGSESMQGFVTRSVTNYLNVAGVIALVVWGFELSIAKDASTTRNRVRWALLLMMMLLLALLGWLHTQMDKHLDTEMQQVLDLPLFTRLHSWYLIISTLQWLFGLAFTGLTLSAWHQESKPNDSK